VPGPRLRVASRARDVRAGAARPANGFRLFSGTRTSVGPAVNRAAQALQPFIGEALQRNPMGWHARWPWLAFRQWQNLRELHVGPECGSRSSRTAHSRGRRIFRGCSYCADGRRKRSRGGGRRDDKRCARSLLLIHGATRETLIQGRRRCFYRQFSRHSEHSPNHMS